MAGDSLSAPQLALMETNAVTKNTRCNGTTLLAQTSHREFDRMQTIEVDLMTAFCFRRSKADGRKKPSGQARLIHFPWNDVKILLLPGITNCLKPLLVEISCMSVVVTTLCLLPAQDHILSHSFRQPVNSFRPLPQYPRLSHCPYRLASAQVTRS
jgi:hypothetical protein